MVEKTPDQTELFAKSSRGARHGIALVSKHVPASRATRKHVVQRGHLPTRLRRSVFPRHRVVAHADAVLVGHSQEGAEGVELVRDYLDQDQDFEVAVAADGDVVDLELVQIGGGLAAEQPVVDPRHQLAEALKDLGVARQYENVGGPVRHGRDQAWERALSPVPGGGIWRQQAGEPLGAG